EVIAMLVALQLVVGRRQFWLPARWCRREIAGESGGRLVNGLLRLIRWFERLSRPPFGVLLRPRPSRSLCGALVLACPVTAFPASPVLVGAVTTLIVLVSVYLSYNANTGLPFVPTYNLRAQLPGGANLVPGNEVRLGGFRVGVIDKIEPGTAIVRGRPRSVAVLLMKLDKSAQPLPSA